MSAEATRYPGTSSFRDAELDRKLFKGREKEKIAFFHRVLVEPLVVLYAQSGCGKTSLINAGLMEPLRQERYFPVVVRVNDPSAGFLSTIIQGVQDAAKKSELECQVGQTSSLWAFFKGLEVWRGDYLLTPVVIFDQFEEIFTLHSPESRVAFVSEFTELIRGRSDGGAPVVKIVMSLREDYLGDLEELSQAIPNILSNRLRLLPLNRDDARSAIEEPAALMDDRIASAPFEYTPGTVDRILEFLSKKRSPSGRGGPQEIQPFQLQLICQNVERIVQSSQKPGSRGTIDYQKDLHGDAGVQLLMQDFYERQMREVSNRSPQSRRRLQRLCETGLISARGRRLNLEEIHIKDTFRIEPETLAILVKRRLLRAEPRGADTFYELSHDTLVEPILDSRRARRRRFRLRVGAVSALSIVVLVASWWAGVNSPWYQTGLAVKRGQEVLLEVRDEDVRGRWTMALALFGDWKTAFAVADGFDNPINKAGVLVGLANIETTLPNAKTAYSEALSAVTKVEDLRTQARLLARLSSVLARTGDSPGAESLFVDASKALDSYRAGDAAPQDVPFAFIRTSLNLDAERQREEGKRLLQEALDAAAKLEPSLLEDNASELLQGLSSGFLKFGDLERADPDWLAIRLKVNAENFDRALLYIEIAKRLTAVNQADKRRQYYEKAIEDASKTEDGGVFGLISQSMLDGGNLRPPSEFLKGIIPKVKDRYELTGVASELAKTDPKAALEAVRAFEPAADRLDVLVGTASTLVGFGKLAEASSFVDEAKRALEQIQKLPEEPSDDAYNGVLGVEVKVLAAQGHITEAIAVAAGARGTDNDSYLLSNAVNSLVLLASREERSSKKSERLTQAEQLAERITLEGSKDDAFHVVGLGFAAANLYRQALEVSSRLLQADRSLDILAGILVSDAIRRSPMLAKRTAELNDFLP